jgi:hypothetical protein
VSGLIDQLELIMNKSNIDVIIEQASSSKSDEDYQSFFNSIRRKELFFNLSNSDEIKNSNDEIKVPTVSVGENLNAVVFYTSPSDGRLGDKYAGIVWEKGLEMVSKMPSANGVIIQSESDAWIAIEKNKIEELLSYFKRNKPE